MTTNMIEIESSEDRIAAFKSMMLDLTGWWQIEVLLQTVNYFFNINIKYVPDARRFPEKDNWASLESTLNDGVGDCEDFAIAKYTTLKRLGMDDLKLACVTVDNQLHIVVICHGYYLDNIIDTITTMRPDLSLVYTFNDEYLWVGDKVANATEHLSQWRNLLAREQATETVA